jgi:hypothetical protein
MVTAIFKILINFSLGAKNLNIAGIFDQKP